MADLFSIWMKQWSENTWPGGSYTRDAHRQMWAEWESQAWRMQSVMAAGCEGWWRWCMCVCACANVSHLGLGRGGRGEICLLPNDCPSLFIWNTTAVVPAHTPPTGHCPPTGHLPQPWLATLPPVLICHSFSFTCNQNLPSKIEI